MYLRLFLATSLLPVVLEPASGQGFPAPKTLGPVETYGANLQRSMSLLATSTGLKRNTVRILFYGQSISASDWTRVISERLKRQYPLADIVVENRAIAGFHSNLLVKTAESDIASFYPDLVILHDYGDAGPFEQILRLIRERTTADLVIATDHVAPHNGERMDETIDPAKLSPPKPGENDAAWRSYVFLPAMAKKYGAELADVRTLWKRYLTDHKLSPSNLLFDDLHLNDHGNYLMAEIISAHLRHRPEPLGDDERVKTLLVGPEGDVAWKNGKLTVPFAGNKVDLVCREESSSKPAAIRIDGKKPSEFPQLYLPLRTRLVAPDSRIPVLLRVQYTHPRVIEDWKLLITELSPDHTRYKMKLTGSVTGEDGEVESGKRFVSKSGRVVIDPDDLTFDFPLVASSNPRAATLECQWSVVPMFKDEFVVPAARNPFGDTVVTIAQGLPNTKHTLEISGGPDTPIAAIRISRPPLRP